jgi:prevent-host-death family protein
MAVVHMTEAEAARDFAGVMARVRAGEEVVIEKDARPIAVVKPAIEFRPRTISESIALAKKHEAETGIAPVLDPDFAADLEEIIKNRRPRDTSAWD